MVLPGDAAALGAPRLSCVGPAAPVHQMGLESRVPAWSGTLQLPTCSPLSAPGSPSWIWWWQWLPTPTSSPWAPCTAPSSLPCRSAGGRLVLASTLQPCCRTGAQGDAVPRGHPDSAAGCPRRARSAACRRRRTGCWRRCVLLPMPPAKPSSARTWRSCRQRCWTRSRARHPRPRG